MTPIEVLETMLEEIDDVLDTCERTPGILFSFQRDDAYARGAYTNQLKINRRDIEIVLDMLREDHNWALDDGPEPPAQPGEPTIDH